MDGLSRVERRVLDRDGEAVTTPDPRRVMMRALSQIAFWSESAADRKIAQDALRDQQEAFRLAVIREEANRRERMLPLSRLSPLGGGPNPEKNRAR